MKTHHFNYHHCCFFWFFAVATSNSTFAETISYEKLLEDLRICAIIDNQHSRIQCYDNLAQSITIGDSANQKFPNEKSESGQKIIDFGIARIEPNPNNGEALVDKVVAVHEYAPNKKLIKLSSGQVWKQMLAQRFNIAKQETVRIYKKGSRESFILSVEGRNTSIQVERIQ